MRAADELPHRQGWRLAMEEAQAGRDRRCCAAARGQKYISKVISMVRMLSLVAPSRRQEVHRVQKSSGKVKYCAAKRGPLAPLLDSSAIAGDSTVFGCCAFVLRPFAPLPTFLERPLRRSELEMLRRWMVPPSPWADFLGEARGRQVFQMLRTVSGSRPIYASGLWPSHPVEKAAVRRRGQTIRIEWPE